MDNNSTVNKISRYMRANIGLVTKYSKKLSENYDYRILMGDTKINPYKLVLMNEYLQEYKKI